MMMKAPLALTCTAAVAFGLSACGSSDSENADSDELSGTVNVYAAASLNQAFDTMAEEFNNEHPEVDIVFNYDGSSGLVQQLQDGAPADVFASADEANMQIAEDEDLVAGDPETFTSNVLTLVTPADNPADIASLEDAAEDDADLVVCAPQVPCGAATETIVDDAGLSISPASEEQSVTDVLGKVTSGEADAGLVYVTDALSAGENVETVELDNADAAVNNYPIAQLEDADNPEAAEAFIDWVLSDDGQAILEEDGFTQP